MKKFRLSFPAFAYQGRLFELQVCGHLKSSRLFEIHASTGSGRGHWQSKRNACQILRVLQTPTCIWPPSLAAGLRRPPGALSEGAESRRRSPMDTQCRSRVGCVAARQSGAARLRGNPARLCGSAARLRGALTPSAASPRRRPLARAPTAPLSPLRSGAARGERGAPPRRDDAPHARAARGE
jgi:hypothetical protein